MKIKDCDELVSNISRAEVKEHRFENVELKRGWTKDYGEKASMLCNAQVSEKCFLVLGVEDDGELSKQNETWLQKTLPILSQQINAYLDPVIANIDITTELIDESYIIIVTLLNPGVVVKWNGSAFVGAGTTKRKLEVHEILELNLSLPGLTDLSKQKRSYTSLAPCVELFCDVMHEAQNEETLRKYYLHDTVAGRILLGDCNYRIVKYSKSGEIVENSTRVGLIGLITNLVKNEIRDYYSTNNSSGIKISDVLLREALGNCVGHAAFQEKDGEIVVELHPDKLVVSNLCYAEYISLANKWFSHAHSSPNPFLMEVLRTMSKVDELGRGKQALLRECLVAGFKPPVVDITNAARHKRWTLTISFFATNDRFLRLRKRLNEKYYDEPEKALISYALILWHKKPFTEIVKYFDSYLGEIAANIVTDSDSPIFYWEKNDRLILDRWVTILLEEGKASKGFSMHEETQIYKRCRDYHCKFYSSVITPAQFRKRAELSDSPSDKQLATKTLKKWVDGKKLNKVGHGKYRFPNTELTAVQREEIKTIYQTLVKAFSSD